MPKTRPVTETAQHTKTNNRGQQTGHIYETNTNKENRRVKSLFTYCNKK
jgi:hypothetical protein